MIKLKLTTHPENLFGIDSDYNEINFLFITSQVNPNSKSSIQNLEEIKERLKCKGSIIGVVDFLLYLDKVLLAEYSASEIFELINEPVIKIKIPK